MEMTDKKPVPEGVPPKSQEKKKVRRWTPKKIIVIAALILLGLLGMGVALVLATGQDLSKEGIMTTRCYLQGGDLRSSGYGCSTTVLCVSPEAATDAGKSCKSSLQCQGTCEEDHVATFLGDPLGPTPAGRCSKQKVYFKFTEQRPGCL